MKEVKQFKPLWRIHNSVYRRCARGSTRIKLRRYLDKAKRMLKIKH